MEEQIKKRPTFITVLGILGFIGVGWQIISGFIQMAAGAVTSAMVDAGQEISEGMSEIEGMSETMGSEGMEQLNNVANEGVALLQHQSTLGIIGIIAAIVCLVGIILMWKLKKTGFYIYVLGEIAPVIATLVLVGFGLGGFMAALGMIVPIVFIILWGVNLKHMS